MSASGGACDTVPSLKILMTADALGGVWQYSFDLISHLARRGAEVLLATMGPAPGEGQKQRLAGLRGITLCESAFKLEWMQQPWDDVDAAGAWLLDLAAQFQPDVIHLNGYAHAALPWKAPALVVAHSCVFSWWQAVHGATPPAHDWTEYHRRVAAGLRAADTVIAPSAFMAGELTAHYGLTAGGIRVIHNFSESNTYRGAPKEPFYLAAGRIWDAGKNLEILGRIASCPPWPIRLAGNNQLPGESRVPAPNLRLLGPLPHESLIDEMQRASIFVHPAFYEPFGLAILEAARAQCCLVLSDIPSLRELWDGAAVFVDPRDPDQWAHTLTRLASNAVARESLGHLARLQANNYTAANAIEQYWNVYDCLSQPDKCSSKEGAAA